MRVGNKNRNWLRAVVILTLWVTATVAVAKQPSPLERAGRTLGVCWGDGYHACADSGLRLGADLPPRSFSAVQRAGVRAAHGCLVHRGAATFYDRFDAANGRRCDALGSCDPPASCSCAPQYQSPEFGAPIEVPYSPNPSDPVIDAAPESIPIGVPSPEPAASVQPAKRYPIRPQPPESTAHGPIGTRLPTLGFNHTPADRFEPVSTQTPEQIQPFPGDIDQYTRPVRVITQQPMSTSTPAMVMPPFMPTEPTPPSAAKIVPTELPATPPFYRTMPSYPTVPVQPTVPSPLTMSSPPPVPSQSTMPSQPAVPSYAKEPPMPAAPATTQTKRPQRLGAQSADPSEPNIGQQSKSAPIRPKRSIRPKRLGSASVQINPYLARPAIELAKRSLNSSENVVHQPNAGALK